VSLKGGGSKPSWEKRGGASPGGRRGRLICAVRNFREGGVFLGGGIQGEGGGSGIMRGTKSSKGGGGKGKRYDKGGKNISWRQV